MTFNVAAQSGDILCLLKRLLLEVGVPPEQITDHAAIADDLDLESVAFVELQVALEEELGIEIDPIHIIELNDLSRIARYLESLHDQAKHNIV